MRKKWWTLLLALRGTYCAVFMQTTMGSLNRLLILGRWRSKMWTALLSSRAAKETALPD